MAEPSVFLSLTSGNTDVATIGSLVGQAYSVNGAGVGSATLEAEAGEYPCDPYGTPCPFYDEKILK